MCSLFPGLRLCDCEMQCVCVSVSPSNALNRMENSIIHMKKNTGIREVKNKIVNADTREKDRRHDEVQLNSTTDE